MWKLEVMGLRKVGAILEGVTEGLDVVAEKVVEDSENDVEGDVEAVEGRSPTS